MLTFFRRIRKRLLDGGSTSKYLVYAIGEIALVVIGILIAFQLSDWNDKRLETAKETQYLISLSEDLGNDLININLPKRLIFNIVWGHCQSSIYYI